MHTLCMATKTISLKLAAYDKLRTARRYPQESFSEVVMRAAWPEDTASGAELLARCRRQGSILSTEALDQIERMKVADEPAGDKWNV